MSKTKTGMKFGDIINQSKPTVVDFYADWCGPCKMMTPILKDLARKLGDRVTIIKIDVDKNRGLAQRLKIQGVPTIAIYKKGKMVWRQAGVQRTPQLLKVLEPLLDKQ